MLDTDRTPGPITNSFSETGSEPFPRASVLVVEDHEDLRFLIKTLLKQRGDISIVEAENGEMAVALAKNLHLDLILMDGTLPVLDGFEATRRIRELASAHEVPIIFLSGHAVPAAQAAAYDAGCDGFLVKPIDFDEWDRVLERYLPRKKSNEGDTLRH